MLVVEVIVYLGRYHISYVVIQIDVLCNLELQELGIWQTIQNDS